jgi:hypothetical protein
MGQEIRCGALIDGKTEEGRLLLESDALLFRSPNVRLNIPFGEIAGVSSRGGTLVVGARRKTYEFDVGNAAERWVRRITNPKTLVEKLGVKSEEKVVYVGSVDLGLLAELKAAKIKVEKELYGGELDCVFIGVESPTDLRQIKGLMSRIKSNGKIWVIFPKGRADLKDVNVIAAGKSAGLVDNKVARISERLTAMKLVIPVKRRK